MQLQPLRHCRGHHAVRESNTRPGSRLPRRALPTSPPRAPRPCPAAMQHRWHAPAAQHTRAQTPPAPAGAAPTTSYPAHSLRAGPGGIAHGPHRVSRPTTRIRRAGVTSPSGELDHATDALARWLDVRAGLGFANGPLFCRLADTPLHPQYVRNLLHRLAARAGVDTRVHPHGLPHVRGRAGTRRRHGHRDQQVARPRRRHVTGRYLDHLSYDDAGRALRHLQLPPIGEVA
jgi:hypothetical protein